MSERLPLADRIDWLAKRLRPRVPFTALNTVWWHLDKKAFSILDIGSGRGEPMRFINRKGQFITLGIDIFEPYLREARRYETHDSYVCCDVRRLPFRSQSFDIVLCLEVLEHLKREDGQALISAMEEIACRQIIISTPVGEYEQHHLDGNPNQEHQAIWKPAELRKLGYTVRGHGLSRIGGERGLASRLPKILVPFTNILYILAGPFVYFAPGLGGAMVGIKKLRQYGRV